MQADDFFSFHLGMATMVQTFAMDFCKSRIYDLASGRSMELGCRKVWHSIGSGCQSKR